MKKLFVVLAGMFCFLLPTFAKKTVYRYVSVKQAGEMSGYLNIVDYAESKEEEVNNYTFFSLNTQDNREICYEMLNYPEIKSLYYSGNARLGYFDLTKNKDSSGIEINDYEEFLRYVSNINYKGARHSKKKSGGGILFIAVLVSVAFAMLKWEALMSINLFASTLGRLDSFVRPASVKINSLFRKNR